MDHLTKYDGMLLCVGLQLLIDRGQGATMLQNAFLLAYEVTSMTVWFFFSFRTKLEGKDTLGLFELRTA